MPPRRPQSKQKLPSKQAIQKKSPAVEEDAEAAEKFKVELQWCVQQIEAAMQKASIKEKAPKLKKHSAVPEKSMFLRKSAIHSPSTTTGPPMHFQDGVEKTPPAEDPNLPDSESSSALNTKEPEHGESKGGGTSTSDSNELGNLSEGSVGDKKTASNPFRFPSQSENAFKFNFSIS
ncbi:uncharacterized protein LOC123515424 isoform X2 [Portunus trituberculatus]|uniref:uncharacterized protein LOC123515424 isoform X2 n=1 Tax=Portunus trituberculatus TaxID=210409 RepID=UPI001E1CB451|nr:uncharacterized protein LOC123515424 isoform X2 [Portunus trituberculatus]